jgi:hypothetical protein
MDCVDVTALDWMFKFTERKETPNERFLAKLEEHVEGENGDPNPGQRTVMACGYNIGKALSKRRLGDAAFSDAEWDAAAKFGTHRVPPTLNEVFLAKLQEHVEGENGNPNPGQQTVMACGYQIGRALTSRRNGKAAFSDVEWAAAAKFGTHRVPPTPNEVFLAKLQAHVEVENSDPNPSASTIMACGYNIGAALSTRRTGKTAFSDVEWDAAAKFGTFRERPRKPGGQRR